MAVTPDKVDAVMAQLRSHDKNVETAARARANFAVAHDRNTATAAQAQARFAVEHDRGTKLAFGALSKRVSNEHEHTRALIQGRIRPAAYIVATAIALCLMFLVWTIFPATQIVMDQSGNVISSMTIPFIQWFVVIGTGLVAWLITILLPGWRYSYAP